MIIACYLGKVKLPLLLYVNTTIINTFLCLPRGEINILLNQVPRLLNRFIFTFFFSLFSGIEILCPLFSIGQFSRTCITVTYYLRLWIMYILKAKFMPLQICTTPSSHWHGMVDHTTNICYLLQNSLIQLHLPQN